MGLFTKSIGPVFLKSSNQAEEYISKLKLLLEKCDGRIKENIEKQIAIAEYGVLGEKNVAFELKNSGSDMYILQDICLEHNELTAQIDYLIVTRKRIYIIECKNLIGDIEINNGGDFVRTYQLKGRKIKEGIYSPITQNARHLQIIKEVRKTVKGNFITKKLFENYFDENYKSIVVLANPKTILNAKFAKKEVKEQIVRADQLVQRIKEMDKQVKEAMSEKEMIEVANFFLAQNQESRKDYAEKYAEVLKAVQESNVGNTTVDNTAADNTITENVTREQLITELKAFRLERSRQEKIKPYFIFNDAQMEELIDKYPKSIEELCQVSGFGKVKADKYGEVILGILNSKAR